MQINKVMKRFSTYYINDAVIIKIGSVQLTDADLFALDFYPSGGMSTHYLDGGFVQRIAPYNPKIASYMLSGFLRGMMFFVDTMNPA